MSYATVTDLLNEFAAEEIAQRADRAQPRLVTAEMLITAAAGEPLDLYTEDEQAATLAAVALIEQKLTDAESMVNGYIGTRYSVPLGVVPRLVKKMVLDMARYALYDDLATETIANRNKDAHKLAESIGAGKIGLGIDPAGNKPKSNEAAEISSSRPVFSRDDSKGFI